MLQRPGEIVARQGEGALSSEEFRIMRLELPGPVKQVVDLEYRVGSPVSRTFWR